MSETTQEIPPTKCISELETRHAYLELVASRKCGGRRGGPCFRDVCAHCGPVLKLIDKRALECDARGCSPRHCVFDA